jgi:hypothetical protein
VSVGERSVSLTLSLIRHHCPLALVCEVLELTRTGADIEVGVYGLKTDEWEAGGGVGEVLTSMSARLLRNTS